MFVLSPEAMDRPKRTIDAAEVLHGQARAIARACAAATASDVVIAVVERDLSFGGVWTVPGDYLCERAIALGAGGWTLVFAPRASIAEIESRCLGMARLAYARWEALRRWSAKHA